MLTSLMNLRDHLGAALPHAQKCATFSGDDGSAKECLTQLEVSLEWVRDVIKELMPGLPNGMPDWDSGPFRARLKTRSEWK